MSRPQKQGSSKTIFKKEKRERQTTSMKGDRQERLQVIQRNVSHLHHKKV